MHNHRWASSSSASASTLAVALAAALTLAGCPKGRSGAVDPTLPEQVVTVAADTPLVQLEAGAGSLDPGPRARALALLVANSGPEPWARRALLDPSGWVRRATIEELGRRSDPESRALLEGVAADRDADPYLRGLAAMRAPGPTSAKSMEEALTTEREAWRIAPLALAAVRLGDGAAQPALLSALSTGELPLDLEFMVEVGRSGDPAVAGALETAQGRAEEELVLPIASARLMLGDASGEQELRKALAEDDEERRLEALDYLVELDHPAATALLRRASALGPELVTWYADLALAARNGNDSELFAKAYADPDRELRALAVRFAGRAAAAGGRRVDKSAAKVVVEALSDPDTAVRVEACHAAAALHLAEARPAAEQLLTDEVEIVRIEASGALLALAGPGGR